MTEQPDDIAEQAKALLRGLEKLPPYTGISFRGRSADATFGRTGKSAVSRGLVATSLDVQIATENFTAAGLFVVLGTSGRPVFRLSQHPEEGEIVFLPSTMFLQVDTWEVAGVPVSVVEQLDPKRDKDAEPVHPPLAQVREIVERYVRRAQVRGEMTIHSPGKFCGDID